MFKKILLLTLSVILFTNCIVYANDSPSLQGIKILKAEVIQNGGLNTSDINKIESGNGDENVWIFLSSYDFINKDHSENPNKFLTYTTNSNGQLYSYIIDEELKAANALVEKVGITKTLSGTGVSYKEREKVDNYIFNNYGTHLNHKKLLYVDVFDITACDKIMNAFDNGLVLQVTIDVSKYVTNDFMPIILQKSNNEWVNTKIISYSNGELIMEINHLCPFVLFTVNKDVNVTDQKSVVNTAVK